MHAVKWNTNKQRLWIAISVKTTKIKGKTNILNKNYGKQKGQQIFKIISIKFSKVIPKIIKRRKRRNTKIIKKRVRKKSSKGNEHV